ncbi:hypothetical protein ACGFX4_28970 [Kitasatospora sp. NPDC048365]|uniref:hypothetical protein n=1 Tax=Kitasatospora sp. NPDC048365 TaxID=3364050 RepID=UPI003710BB44
MRIPRTLRRVLIAGAAASLLGGALWWCYAWYFPGLAGPATASGVDSASRPARAAAQQRLDETVAALPGGARTLGDAAADRCLRDAPFEGAGPGLLQCQWELSRYLVVDGAAAGTIGENWSGALTGVRWKDLMADAPPGVRGPEGRQDFDGPRSHERLVVTVIRSRAELDAVPDLEGHEGVQEYLREQHAFAGREAAAQALAEGRAVVRIFLTRAYHREGGGDPVPVD